MRPGIKAWQHSTRWSFLIRIRHLHISHNTPCLPPKFCIFHFSWVLQPSQNFGGQANKVNFGCSASGQYTMAENLILCAFYIGKMEKLPNKQHCSIPMILKEWRFSRWDMILQTNILQQISWKLQEACGTHRDPFISDACCFSQPCFDEAANLSYKLGGEGGGGGGTLITVHCRSANMNVWDLADLRWRKVVSEGPVPERPMSANED